MDELFLYDRDLGLFKEILNKSSIIQGRYHVSPSGGKDLDTNNLETFIKDPASGLSDVKNKYPICVCMTPRSRETTINGQLMEIFVFDLFFVTTTYFDKTGVKWPDLDTNTSTHHVWYDWQDMKRCASNFIQKLKEIVRKGRVDYSGQQMPLNQVSSLQGDVIYNRLTRFNNDRLSGVKVSFSMFLNPDICKIDDYADVPLEDIIIPPFEIHPHHT